VVGHVGTTRECEGAVSEPSLGAATPEVLEEPGVGRIMGSGEDEDEARAARMDGWVAWEHEERREGD